MRPPIYIGLISLLIASCSTNHGRVELSDHKDKRVVLVDYGHFDRAAMARAINVINQAEPKIIGINALFRDLKFDKGDTLLSEAIMQQ